MISRPQTPNRLQVALTAALIAITGAICFDLGRDGERVETIERVTNNCYDIWDDQELYSQKCIHDAMLILNPKENRNVE